MSLNRPSARSAARVSLVAAAVALLPLGVAAGPAAAATEFATATTSCENTSAAMSFDVVTSGPTKAAPLGVVRSVTAHGSGEFSDDPAMTVVIRDGAGKVVVSKTTTDGSMALSFWRRVQGEDWTVEATLTNTAAGACASPRVPVAWTSADS